MRNSLSSFALAFLVSVSALPFPSLVEARKGDSEQKHNYSYLTRGCTFKGSSVRRRWEKAVLTARIPEGEESEGSVEILSGAQNPDKRLPLASLTKLMTAYLVFKAVDEGRLFLSQRIPVSQESLCLANSKYAVDYLPRDIVERGILVSDAMTHILRLSSNPMALNLAIAADGSEEDFVKEMNRTAQEWGMKNTHFMNPHGLPVGNRTEEHTTANDLLIMARHILPFLDRYKLYAHAPLMVDSLPYREKTNEGKELLREWGAVFKTGTIHGCRSLVAIVEDRESTIVSIQLCTGKARLYNALNILEGFFEKPPEITEPIQTMPQALSSAL